MSSYDQLVSYIQQHRTLLTASAVLAWDQQTMMPPKAAASRANQLAMMAGLAHEHLADPRLQGWLDELAGSSQLTDLQRATLRNIGREVRRATRVPKALVERLGKLQAEGFTAWHTARAEDDFTSFAPKLEELVEALKEKAAAIDADRPVLDVLMDEFEPGSSVASLSPMFERLQGELVTLLQAIRGAPPLPALQTAFDPKRQVEMHQGIIKALGYDMEGGRLDASAHPFTIGLGEGDVRITTRVAEHHLLSGLGGTVHETGHALYEQGLPYELTGTGVASAASMGIHESQSRFWENFIGRSLPFFRWLQGPLGEHFPHTPVSPERLFQAANRVAPGLIRVEADEVTYNLHVIVRFELERDLMSGRLAVRDLPEAWNDKYEKTVGVRPPNDAQGCLQDVHWATGAFGYFPSYTLGNLYAASFGAHLTAELPELWRQVEAGQFEQVLCWLRTHVHQVGHLYDTPEIVRRAVGQRDHVEDLMAYLWSRHGAAHGLTR